MPKITIHVFVAAPLKTVWECWNEPAHITQWAFAASDWECPYAENDAVVGGRFLTQMAAKDGSVSFDITGSYTLVEPLKRIDSVLDDNRTVSVEFIEARNGMVQVVQEFEMESENSEELQRFGWQAILNHFKAHVESVHAHVTN